MKPKRLADGSGSGRNRMESACVHALHAYIDLKAKADRVCAQIDLDDSLNEGENRPPSEDGGLT